MMLATAIGLFVLIATGAIVAGTRWYLRAPRSRLPEELVTRQRALRAILDDIIARVPDRPRIASDEVPDHPRAASIEAKILAGSLHAALAEAEALFACSPEDARVSLLLARVLIHGGEIDAAMHQLERARARGASGPMLDYLEGRAHHSIIVRQLDIGNERAQESPLPTLISPFEMFMLQLERHRQRSDKAAELWIASAGNLTVDSDRVVALISEYLTAYCESLEKLAAAAIREPSFGEALYHTARLAMKAGFVEQGLTLLRKIEPLMATSAERQAYQRDLSTLSGTEPAPARPAIPAVAATAPAVAPTARRSARLKVLN